MFLALATLGVMGGTAWVGWTAVPVIGFVTGLVLPNDRAALVSAVAGALGWGFFLAAGAVQGPVGDLARLTGAVLGGVPGPVLLLVTLLFPALLGAAAAGVGAALRDLRRIPQIA